MVKLLRDGRQQLFPSLQSGRPDGWLKCGAREFALDADSCWPRWPQ